MPNVSIQHWNVKCKRLRIGAGSIHRVSLYLTLEENKREKSNLVSFPAWLCSVIACSLWLFVGSSWEAFNVIVVDWDVCGTMCRAVCRIIYGSNEDGDLGIKLRFIGHDVCSVCAATEKGHICRSDAGRCFQWKVHCFPFLIFLHLFLMRQRLPHSLIKWSAHQYECQQKPIWISACFTLKWCIVLLTSIFFSDGWQCVAFDWSYLYLVAFANSCDTYAALLKMGEVSWHVGDLQQEIVGRGGTFIVRSGGSMMEYCWLLLRDHELFVSHDLSICSSPAAVESPTRQVTSGVAGLLITYAALIECISLWSVNGVH